MTAIDTLIENGGRAATAPDLTAQSSDIMAPTGGSGGGYGGADSSQLRGMVYFPQLDTRKEINPHNRKEMLRRARWLFANIGMVKRAIKGVARMVVGTGMTPQPITTDKEWNELALAAFNRRTGQAKVFDLAEKYNFNRSQLAVVGRRQLDGDMGVALSSSATNRARFAFYESHQIGTARWNTGLTGFETDGWYDGVFTDRLNAARKYRILGDEAKHVDIATRDFLFQCEYDRPGQRRGVTVLHHAINNLLDVTEIQTAFKMNIKQASRAGYYIEDKAASSSAGAGIAGAMQAAVKQLETTSGAKINVEDVYGQGGEIQHVPSGKELKMLLDQRPHQNVMSFIDHLIRDIAWGIGISPELLWNIAKLGGANTRFILADAQGFINEQQQLLVDQYCSPVWNYTIAKEIKYGALRPCEDPDWMFKMGWIPPARVTVDFGRDGKLHMQQLERGMLTYKKFYGWNGEDWKPNLEQWIDERAHIIKYAKDKHNLTAAELLATLPTTPIDEPTSAASKDDDATATEET